VQDLTEKMLSVRLSVIDFSFETAC